MFAVGSNDSRKASRRAPRPSPPAVGSHGRGRTARPRTRGLLRRRLAGLSQLAITVAVFVVAILVWALVVNWFDIDQDLVPAPQDVGHALLSGAQKSPSATDGWYHNAYVTGTEMLVGFAIAAVVGVVLAVLVSSSRFTERTIVPFIVAFQAIPKIAVAPLFVIWFGLGISSKIWLTAAVTFFPVFVNTLSGFASVDADSKLLMRAYGATRYQLIRYLVVPSSLPSIFAGFEIGLVFSLTASVVGEFMGGTEGLGSYLAIQQGAINTPGVFAALIILGFMGAIANFLLVLLRKRVLYWVSPTSVIGG
ncbi:ABC transporter permease [Streptomyces sp. NPDC051014]|uniref:ABC transporter permease n=1 Tax=Streptomyces sp. NPDC051014 TaxID=3155751 RepID=UPI0034010035